MADDKRKAIYELPFSQRYGYAEVPRRLESDELPEDARRRILDVLYEFTRRQRNEWGDWVYHDEWKQITQDLLTDQIGLSLEDVDAMQVQDRIRRCEKIIKENPVQEVIDLLEGVIHHKQCPGGFIDAMRTTFAASRLAYSIDRSKKRILIGGFPEHDVEIPTGIRGTESSDPDRRDNETEEIAGLDSASQTWGDYPIDHLLIRQESRTIFEVFRRIERKMYIMNPEFQREFIWDEDKQSKLIESVFMRIPLPVFYLAEDSEGRMIVVDGLQRISTFVRFLRNELTLRLRHRSDLDGKRFEELTPKLQNRFEDANLIFYTIDSKVPERARLDIFERVNGGVPLTRQQMRNSLYQGPGTRFVKEEAVTGIFLDATGRSLNPKTMRDREFVNRFCAFRILDLSEYRGDMDAFLATTLKRMNKMTDEELSHLSCELRTSLHNNYFLFGKHTFRKHFQHQENRWVLNASLWDVLSTGLANYEDGRVAANAKTLRDRIRGLFLDEEFNRAITNSPNSTPRVRYRFEVMGEVLQEILGDSGN